MTLESTFEFLTSQGWLVGSLCQLTNHEWYACLIDDGGFAHTASGTSPAEAVAIAFERPPMGRLYSHTEGVYVDEEEKPIDLVALGLMKKRPPVRRI